jgi:hypothetical protein
MMVKVKWEMISFQFHTNHRWPPKSLRSGEPTKRCEIYQTCSFSGHRFGAQPEK